MRQMFKTIDLGVRILVTKDSPYAKAGTEWSVGAGCSQSIACQLVNDGFAEIVQKAPVVISNKRQKGVGDTKAGE